jgi:flagellar biosynthesis chaperone FliJ
MLLLDSNQLEHLGDQLREIGHRRHELAEQVFQQVSEGDIQSSKDLYNELISISDKAIEIIMRQKQLFNEEVQKM